MIQPLRRTATVLVLLSGIAATPARADDPTGSWLTQAGEAHIRVAKCGKAMCGSVAWLRDTVDLNTGQPPVDSKNPDPAKRGRKILGLRIFAMEPDGNGAYTGEIYNSDDGKTYKGRLVPRGADEIEVQGCNANNLCGFELWSRVNTEAPTTTANDPGKKSATPATNQNKK